MRPVLAIRHVPYETLGLLGQVLQEKGVVYSYLDVFQGEVARFQADQLAGLVILGGPMNVDETQKYPFLGAELDWIRQSLAIDLPVLGICLGSQLLAKALGAKVYPGARKEIGWYPLELTDEALDDDSFAGWNRHETVFQWHGDTFDLPPGSTRLASSPLFPNQAFRVGHATYGLQFHLEIGGPMIEDWLVQPGNCLEVDSLDYIDPRAIQDEIPLHGPRLEQLGREFFRRFADRCLERA